MALVRFTLLLAALVTSHALAVNGLIFGVQLAPPVGGAVPLTANVEVPITSFEANDGAPIGVALRVDVSYALGSGFGPSAGVVAFLSDGSHARDVLQAYLGAGVAVASTVSAEPAGSKSGWAPTAYGVVGWRLPLSELFAVRVEGLFNVTLRSAALQLGLDLSPWGRR